MTLNTYANTILINTKQVFGLDQIKFKIKQ